MAFDAIGFFQAYGIEYVTEGEKHCREGWVQIRCPFCVGNPGWHLGYSLEFGFWNCWRCGYKRTWDVVLALLEGDKRKTAEVMEEFKGRPVGRRKRQFEHPEVLELPQGLQPLTKRARKYLEDRKFDPDMLEAVWKIQSTSNIGRLSYRIFIPIFIDGKMVSWQCRDITGLSSSKYLAQAEDKEILNNKDVLYGIDQAPTDTCVIVEGVTDVWRLGPGAVATFGIKYKHSQVVSLVSTFKKFHVLFDPDPQAVVQAESLASDISVFGVDVKVWYLDKYDTGDMPQEEADAFMREVGAGGY